MSEEDLKKENFLKEVDGYSSAFFMRLELTHELIFGDDHKETILDLSTKALGKHMTEYQICPRTLDAFKLVGNMGYYAALNVQDRVNPILSKEDPVHEVCQACISKLYSLALEEAREIPCEFTISSEELEYLARMLYNEVDRKGDIGVGANGIGAVFAFMIKALKSSVVPDAEAA